MIATSEIAGRLPIVVSPGASSAAAISFSTLFFAPTTSTSPASRAPPVTRSTCIGTQAIVRRGVAVHLTRIYTRTGDDGTTALGDMSRVRKTDPRVGAYADCDETNAALGVALALGALPDAGRRRAPHGPERPVRRRRRPVHAGASATPRTRRCGSTDGYVDRLEEWCDEFNADLPQARQLHPARRHARRGAAAPGAHGLPAAPSAAPGRCTRPTRSPPTASPALPEPALRPAVHPVPGRQPRRRRPVAPGGDSDEPRRCSC